MGYIENPKTRGSGIICAIPQEGECPNRCDDCFFQSGRSYLEPLSDNLPNMPPLELACGRVVRVNDGNDSHNNLYQVMESTKHYPDKFYNTACPFDLGKYDAPFVLTINPGKMTDNKFHHIEPIPRALMFVRFRANMWNTSLMMDAIEYYTNMSVPIVLTFMSYHNEDDISRFHRYAYKWRTRTKNKYYAISYTGFTTVMSMAGTSPLIHSCGIEDTDGGSRCMNCGNCLREYYATKERMK